MNQTESQQQGTDLRLMLAQADALCMERRFEEAASIYQHLVGMAEGRLGPNHPDTVLVVQRLADALYAMNAFRDCLPLYERLCQIARGMLGDSDPDVINLMFKIARTQELIGSFVEARSTYEFAINTAQKNLPPGHELTSQLQGRYEVLCERIDENKRAAQAWKENTVNNPVLEMPTPAGELQKAAPPPIPYPAGMPAPGSPAPPAMPQMPMGMQSPPGMPQMPPDMQPPSMPQMPMGMASPPGMPQMPMGMQSPPSMPQMPPGVPFPGKPMLPPHMMAAPDAGDDPFDPLAAQPWEQGMQAPAPGSMSGFEPPGMSSPNNPFNTGPVPAQAPTPAPMPVEPPRSPFDLGQTAAPAPIQPGASRFDISQVGPGRTQGPPPSDSGPPPNTPDPGAMIKPTGDPYGQAPPPTSNLSSPSSPSNPFGMPSDNPFGRTSDPSGNPFGNGSPQMQPGNPFDSPAHPAGSPFGNEPAHPAGSPFGNEPAHPAGSPFGNGPSQMPAGDPFGNAQPPAGPFGNALQSAPAAVAVQSKPWEQPAPSPAAMAPVSAPPSMINPNPPLGMDSNAWRPAESPPSPPSDPFASGVRPGNTHGGAIGAQLMSELGFSDAPSAPPQGAPTGMPPNAMPPSGSGNPGGFGQPGQPQMMSPMSQPPMQAPPGYTPLPAGMRGPNGGGPGDGGMSRPQNGTGPTAGGMQLPPGGPSGMPPTGGMMMPPTGGMAMPQTGGMGSPGVSSEFSPSYSRGEPRPFEGHPNDGPQFPNAGGPPGDFRGSSAGGLQSAAGPGANPFPVNDPFADAGRNKNPDPYMDHLAQKVAGLKAQAQGADAEPPPMPSAFKPQNLDDDKGWHEGVSLPPVTERSQSQEVNRKKVPPIAFNEGTEYGEQSEEVEYEQQSRPAPSKKIKSARSAVSKNEDLVSNVRAFKEYLIPVVALFVIGIGGYFFLSMTASRTPLQVPTDGSAAAAQTSGDVYSSPDGSLRLAVGTTSCTFVDGENAITAPYVIYDGSWSTVAMQCVDSLMEKQIWFNQVPEGMVTDTGSVLFDQKAPDNKVVERMVGFAKAASSFGQTSQGYPKKPAELQSQAYHYTNLFTGQSGFLKLQTVPESKGNRLEILAMLTNGSLIFGESNFSRGEVRAYAITDVSSGVEKGVGFFVRGADRNGNFFRVRDGGQVVTLGYMDGKDMSNCKLAQNVKTPVKAITPDKPTKVWIGKNQSLPIFVLYHSLPISMAVLAFLAFWRSLMVGPGQEADNATNRGFRMFAFVALGVCLLAAGLQYSLWM